ncbi:MAG: general secretion pathway protein GspB, partial [Deltaproteobacteria bacterium]|nr:general secretion pathway protein GspB [Deltaproteobacteria bacterium]
PMVMDLPDEIREKFKDLKINVHAFYENSAESFVFINMRRYVAGDRVGPGNITLIAITPDGAVFDYGEGQALLLTEN